MLSWGKHRGCSCKQFQPQPVLSSLPITPSRDKPARPPPLMWFSSSSELERTGKFFPCSGYKTPFCQQLAFPTAKKVSKKALKKARAVQRASCQQLEDTERPPRESAFPQRGN